MCVKFELDQMLHVPWDSEYAICFLFLRETCEKKRAHQVAFLKDIMNHDISSIPKRKMNEVNQRTTILTHTARNSDLYWL